MESGQQLLSTDRLLNPASRVVVLERMAELEEENRTDLPGEGKGSVTLMYVIKQGCNDRVECLLNETGFLDFLVDLL